MSTKRSTASLILLRSLLVLFGIAIALGAGEIIVRRGLILPNRQIIRNASIRLIDGVPVWRDRMVWEPREHTECVDQHPERTRILFMGTSITHSGYIRQKDTFPQVLEDELNQLRPSPGFCVLNFAQPGFAFGQQYELTKETIQKYHPVLVLDQDWLPSGDSGNVTFTMVGDAAYQLGGLRIRPDGFPGIHGVPDWLNEPLFLHSRLYEWLTMAQGEPEVRPPGSVPSPFPPGERFVPTPGWDAMNDPRYHQENLMRFSRMVKDNGSRPAFFMVADWTYPLNETSPHDKAWAEMDTELGKENGFAVFMFRNAVADQDNTKMRHDAWHISELGNRLIGHKLVPFVLSQLDQK